MNGIRRTTSTDAGLLLIRAMVGVVFAFHGSQKVFGAFDGQGIAAFAGALAKMNVPMPEISAWLAAGTEFGGGLLLIVGLLTRLAALPLAFTMGVAAFVAHAGKFSGPGGGEFALTLMAVALGLALTGPGRLSIDGLLWERPAQPNYR